MRTAYTCHTGKKYLRSRVKTNIIQNNMRLADNTIKKKWMPLHKTRIKRNCYGFVPRSRSDQTEVLTIQTFRDFILHELRDAQPIKKKPKTTKNPLACKKYSKRNMSPFACHVECVCFMNTCLYGFLVSLEFYFCDTRHGEMCCHINFWPKILPRGKRRDWRLPIVAASIELGKSN